MESYERPQTSEDDYKYYNKGSLMKLHSPLHLKDGRWVIFNDEKVAQSENPPRDLAYLYLYRRLWRCSTLASRPAGGGGGATCAWHSWEETSR